MRRSVVGDSDEELDGEDEAVDPDSAPCTCPSNLIEHVFGDNGYQATSPALTTVQASTSADSIDILRREITEANEGDSIMDPTRSEQLRQHSDQGYSEAEGGQSPNEEDERLTRPRKRRKRMLDEEIADDCPHDEENVTIRNPDEKRQNEETDDTEHMMSSRTISTIANSTPVLFDPLSSLKFEASASYSEHRELSSDGRMPTPSLTSVSRSTPMGNPRHCDARQAEPFCPGDSENGVSEPCQSSESPPINQATCGASQIHLEDIRNVASEHEKESQYTIDAEKPIAALHSPMDRPHTKTSGKALNSEYDAQDVMDKPRSRADMSSLSDDADELGSSGETDRSKASAPRKKRGRPRRGSGVIAAHSNMETILDGNVDSKGNLAKVEKAASEPDMPRNLQPTKKKKRGRPRKQVIAEEADDEESEHTAAREESLSLAGRAALRHCNSTTKAELAGQGSSDKTADGSDSVQRDSMPKESPKRLGLEEIDGNVRQTQSSIDIEELERKIPLDTSAPSTPARATVVITAASPLQKGPDKHSPINGSKVSYRVGLSKRARIEPLLRIVKK